jgi:hypothetical protein
VIKWLVGGLEHFNYFSHHIGNVIITTDELHHFSEGWRKTTNQNKIGIELGFHGEFMVYFVGFIGIDLTVICRDFMG